MDGSAELSPRLTAGVLGREDRNSQIWGMNVVPLFPWFRRGWTAVRSASDVPRNRWIGPNPYLLVLLADQELDRNRHDRAEILIDAAYAAFDQCSFWS